MKRDYVFWQNYALEFTHPEEGVLWEMPQVREVGAFFIKNGSVEISADIPSRHRAKLIRHVRRVLHI